MIITNINDFKGLDLYKCNKEKCFELLSNGFSLLSFDKDFFYFLKSDKLKSFLALKGGEDV